MSKVSLVSLTKDPAQAIIVWGFVATALFVVAAAASLLGGSPWVAAAFAFLALGNGMFVASLRRHTRRS